MTREEEARELRQQLYKTLLEEEKFYINYSALALGLLMSLQAFAGMKDYYIVPLVLWIVALLSFVTCLIVAGPVMFFFDIDNYRERALDMRWNGGIEESDPKYRRLDRILRCIDLAVKASFLLGSASAVLYFIFLRVSTCLC